MLPKHRELNLLARGGRDFALRSRDDNEHEFLTSEFRLKPPLDLIVSKPLAQPALNLKQKAE